MPLYAAVEGGGQSWRAAISDGSPENIIAFKQIPSSNISPAVILGEIKTFLGEHKYDSLGISTFGPIDSNPDSDTYGYLLGTPNKPLWRNIDIVGQLWDLHVPCKFVSDVAGPCLAEYTLGAARGSSSCAYITVGTGVNAGFVANGQIIQGLVNTEAGHTLLPERPGHVGEASVGACKLHKGGCVSGVAGASGISLLSNCARGSLQTLPDAHPVWGRVAHALGTLCFSIAIYLSPSKIVLNGGVLQRACLFPMVRSVFRGLMQGFLHHPSFDEGLGDYIIPATWGQKTGIVGALATSKLALDTAETMQSIKRLCRLKASTFYLDPVSSLSMPVIDEQCRSNFHHSVSVPGHLTTCTANGFSTGDSIEPWTKPPFDASSLPRTPVPTTPHHLEESDIGGGFCLTPSLENFWDRSQHGPRPPPPRLSLGLSVQSRGMALSGTFEVAAAAGGGEEPAGGPPPPPTARALPTAAAAAAAAPDLEAPLARAVPTADCASAPEEGGEEARCRHRPVRVALVLQMTYGYLLVLLVALAFVVGYSSVVGEKASSLV